MSLCSVKMTKRVVMENDIVICMCVNEQCEGGDVLVKPLNKILEKD